MTEVFKFIFMLFFIWIFIMMIWTIVGGFIMIFLFPFRNMFPFIDVIFNIWKEGGEYLMLKKPLYEKDKKDK